MGLILRADGSICFLARFVCAGYVCLGSSTAEQAKQWLVVGKLHNTDISNKIAGCKKYWGCTAIEYLSFIQAHKIEHMAYIKCAWVKADGSQLLATTHTYSQWLVICLAKFNIQKLTFGHQLHVAV